MKNLIFTACLMNLLGTLAFPPTGLVAAELNATVSGPAPIPSGQVSVSTQDSAPLPYGAAEVVKLARAQVSEDVIISYVQNSGSTYSLSSDDIVRLRNEGVSDRVINTILTHHNKTMEALPRASVPPPEYADNAGSAAPQQAAVQAPLAPSSSSYVIPYPAATAAYYGYYRPYYYSPYYYGSSYYGYPYYGYYGGPAVSFRFGFGGGHGGSWHGGHGGYGGGHGHGGHGH